MTQASSAAKTIGILTSGGDCAGLNATIRAVATRAIQGYGWRVYGIRQGTMGLMRRPVEYDELDLRIATVNILRLGGTILGTTNRGDPFAYPMPDGSVSDRSAEVIEGVRALGLDALIGVGGDGSFAILRRLAQQGGIQLVGIPKTIDNDVGATENSVGYNTAVAVATEALDRLQPTAASHDRVMILEVMGRDAGHIALAAGIAGGADIILIPEIPYSIEAIAAQIGKIRRDGRNFALIIVAEAVKDRTGQPVQRQHLSGGTTYGGVGYSLGDAIARLTGAETRVTMLGHVQRGSPPTWDDRMLASAFGVHAVDLIAAGKYDCMVAWQNRRVVDVPLADAIQTPRVVDPDGTLVRTARGLGYLWAMTDAFTEFWDFSLALYARPGVAPACLALQDQGRDVIIVLYGCWLGASGRGRLDADRLAAAEATARPWRSTVVEPLRRTRHALKGIDGAEALYARMKEIELEAERVAHRRLAALAPAPDARASAAARHEAARHNLSLYIGADAAAIAAPIVAAVTAAE